jgi:hypothetical protein
MASINLGGRHDQPKEPSFNKHATELVNGQSTVAVGLILVLRARQ